MANDDTTTAANGVLARLRRSRLLRVLGLGGLILILRIPIGMIDETIAERSLRRSEAIGEVTSTWGGRQIVRGPFLTIPYVRRWLDPPRKVDDKPVVRERIAEMQLMPATLTVDGELGTQVLRRGIFDVPLYVATLTLGGGFQLPDRSAFPADTSEIHWHDATLTLGIDDPRAIREQVVPWNAVSVPLRPGAGSYEGVGRGVHAVVPAAAGSAVTFAMNLVVAGSHGISVLPAGADTTVRLAAPWPDPSLDGAFLPVMRTVTPQGFAATWRVLDLARGIPGAWQENVVELADLDKTLLGVALLSPVDTYRTTSAP